MKYLLFNENGQLRSGWRASLFFFSFVFFSYIFILATLGVLAQMAIGASVSSLLPIVVPFAISTAIALFFGWLYGKLFEGLRFRALGTSFRGNWLKHFALGCSVGTVAMASALGLALLSGGLSLSINHESASSAIVLTLLTSLVIFLFAAFSEETLFRGYLLQTFTREELIPVGVAVTSLLFAFAHNSNPANTRLSWFNTLLAGIWFAVAYLKTLDLWFPLGMHLMWNWLQGPVLGINVSGIAAFSPDPILRTTDVGPPWLTGGSYGIEGGLVCTIAIVISIIAIYFLPKLKRDEELIAMTSKPKD